MDYGQIMIWAEARRFPALVLDEEGYNYLRHGREHYERLKENRVNIILASLRIEAWNAVEVGESPRVALKRLRAKKLAIIREMLAKEAS